MSAGTLVKNLYFKVYIYIIYNICNIYWKARDLKHITLFSIKGIIEFHKSNNVYIFSIDILNVQCILK